MTSLTSERQLKPSDRDRQLVSPSEHTLLGLLLVTCPQWTTVKQTEWILSYASNRDAIIIVGRPHTWRQSPVTLTWRCFYHCHQFSPTFTLAYQRVSACQPVTIFSYKPQQKLNKFISTLVQILSVLTVRWEISISLPTWSFPPTEDSISNFQSTCLFFKY